ncbi:alpha-tubulin [Ceratobasidium sp. 423]|nr:alpha-tubulin [Ceratobasidium sp. 423]
MNTTTAYCGSCRIPGSSAAAPPQEFRDHPEYDPNMSASVVLNCSGKHVPRSLYIDLEPGVVDTTRNGSYKGPLHPAALVTGKDAADNYARRHYTVGKGSIGDVVDQIHLLELGSGYGTLLLECLSTDYGNKAFEFCVYPAPKLSSLIQPSGYDSVLTTHTTLQHSGCSFVVANEAIYDICQKNLGASSGSTNLNRSIAQVVSSVTASLHFDGSLNVDLNEFQTDLVPFPCIHFPLTAHAPIVSAAKAGHENDLVPILNFSCFEHTVVRPLGWQIQGLLPLVP